VRSRPAAALAAGAILALALSGCGSTGITAAPLEASLSSTFANLYALQQAEQGNPHPPARSLHSHTGCQKGAPAPPRRART